MKFLKYFEDVQDISPSYKAGDYIFVYSHYKGIYDKFMIIDDETDDDIFACHFVSNDKGEEIFRSEIVRKLTQDEIDALKFGI